MIKILVVYFSHSGNTHIIADQIHKKTEGDIFEIQSVKPYPENYNAVVEQARQELKLDYKPALKTRIENIKSYDVIFICYPNWWATFPAPVKTLLSEYDLGGKTLIPVCTHEGSGLGKSVTDIRKLCPDAEVLDGLAIRGGNVSGAQHEVSAWLDRLGFTSV